MASYGVDQMPGFCTSEALTATSTAHGTTLPRAGIFWGVQPPQRHPTVVVGELTSANADETTVRGWSESHEHLIEQTTAVSFAADLIRIANFELNLSEFAARNYSDLAWHQAKVRRYRRGTTTRFVRATDAACAFLSDEDDVTESPWKAWRDAFAPLLNSSDALLGAIRAELELDASEPDLSHHAGLAAVSWLVRILSLSRPTVLRMGGVPESTFYAWQKSPRSAVRTSSVARLIRLQAQIGVLAQALGPDVAKAWVLAGDRLSKLQGADSEFTEVLSEAEEAVTATTRIKPRPRMRLSDYMSYTEQPAQSRRDDSPTWPRAEKLLDEHAE